MLRRAVVLAVALSLLPASEAGAQVDSQPQPPPPPRRLRIAYGAHYSPVYQVAADIALFPKAREDPHGFSGWFLSLEPGISGGLIGFGRGATGGLALGFVRAAVLRTWGDPGVVAPNQTFVGPDIRLGIVFVSAGVGWYTRISGTASGDSNVWLFNVGIGF